MTKFKVGDKVKKVKGYSWPGEVRSVFTTSTGAVRVVVECTVEEVKGALHIYNEDQLEAVGPEKKVYDKIDEYFIKSIKNKRKKKVYAVALMVPDDSKSYLTDKKMYKVVCEDEKGFDFLSDNGCLRYSTWKESMHLGGKNWTRVEI